MIRSYRVSLLHTSLAAALCLFAAMDATAANTPEEPLELLRGTYTFVGGESEIQAMDRAIEDATSELSFFIRGIAQKRLRQPNLPSAELRIIVDGDSIEVTRTGQPTIAAPASGEAVEWRNPGNGNTLRVRHKALGADKLEQRLRGDRGLSVNRFVLDPNGSRLVIRTTITAEKLPEPLRFSTTYTRRNPDSQP